MTGLTSPAVKHIMGSIATAKSDALGALKEADLDA